MQMILSSNFCRIQMTQTETNMPNHIDYEGETRADKLAFSAQVTQQLQLRNINIEGRINV